MNSLWYTLQVGTFMIHYVDVIMSAMATQITSITIVYSAVYSGVDQRKHQSSASLVFARGIHRWLDNSPQRGPVTWKRFPFDDVIMRWLYLSVVEARLFRTNANTMSVDALATQQPDDGIKKYFFSYEEEFIPPVSYHWWNTLYWCYLCCPTIIDFPPISHSGFDDKWLQ